LTFYRIPQVTLEKLIMKLSDSSYRCRDGIEQFVGED